MTRAARQWTDGPASLVLLEPGTTERSGGESGGEAGETPAGEGRTVPLEVAASPRARTRGLLGRDGIEGALLLTPARSVHTFGMRFAIDVAHLDAELRVLSVCTMAPGRLGTVRLRARHVLEAEVGAMARWGLRAGGAVRVVPAGPSDG